MTWWQGVLGVLVGFAAGLLSGMFGLGGGVVMVPAVDVLLGGTPINAIATPLPVIFPISLVGAFTFARAREVSGRAARWAAGPGMIGAVVGAYLTSRLNTHLLLTVLAGVIAWTGIRLATARPPRTPWRIGVTAGWKYAGVGLGAGFASGLLGVGGGIIMVPALTLLIGMPLRRALGTSLLVMAALVVPGTAVHWWLGHVSWAIFLVLVVGVVPGARLGARIALGVAERRLRAIVGAVLLAIAVLYGAREVVALVETAG